MQNISDLQVKIDWDVPILHTIETRVASFPTKEQTQFMNDLNLEIKKGPFNKEEDVIILNNFREFCDKHGLPPDPRPFVRFNKFGNNRIKNTERVHFVQYLAKGLNNRLLCTVYRRFKNIVVPMERTGWFVFIIQNLDEKYLCLSCSQSIY